MLLKYNIYLIKIGQKGVHSVDAFWIKQDLQNIKGWDMNKRKLHKFFNNKEEFAPNERLWLFCMLMMIAGFFGGFTFSFKR